MNVSDCDNIHLQDQPAERYYCDGPQPALYKYSFLTSFLILFRLTTQSLPNTDNYFYNSEEKYFRGEIIFSYK